MNKMRWLLFAFSAALGVVLLPAVVSAEEASLTGVASDCRDAVGAFVIDWTLEVTDAPTANAELDGFSIASAANVEDGELTIDDGGVADPLTLADFGLASGIGIDGLGSASAQTAYDGSVEPSDTISASGAVQWSLNTDTVVLEQDNIVSNDVARPDYCMETSCLNGDFTEQAVNVLVDSNDCGAERVCVNGESMTVTEYDAGNLDGATSGSCIPQDDYYDVPPGTATTPAVVPTPESPKAMCTIDGVNYVIAENPLLCSGHHLELLP
jgi:hypothetical protein